jgi:hypothetical protein
MEPEGISSAPPSTPTPEALEGPAEAPPAVVVDPLAESAKAYAKRSRADRTKKAYADHWAAFSQWCDQQGLCALPAAPQTVASYLAARADLGRKVSTLEVTDHEGSQRTPDRSPDCSSGTCRIRGRPTRHGAWGWIMIGPASSSGLMETGPNRTSPNWPG